MRLFSCGPYWIIYMIQCGRKSQAKSFYLFHSQILFSFPSLIQTSLIRAENEKSSIFQWNFFLVGPTGFEPVTLPTYQSGCSELFPFIRLTIIFLLFHFFTSLSRANAFDLLQYSSTYTTFQSDKLPVKPRWIELCFRTCCLMDSHVWPI